MQTNKTVVEINGVKMEIDLRHATRVENISVGTRVKVLKKEYGGYKVHHGIVIGFEPFKQLPTIIIAAVLAEYNQTKIEYFYYNAECKDVEVVVAVDDDLAALDKERLVRQLDNEIEKKQAEIAEIENRKQYFLKTFASYWQPLEQAVADALEDVEE